MRDEKKFPLFVCGDAHQVQDYIGGRGTFALKRGQKGNSPKLVLFHKCSLGHSVEEFLPSFPNARGRITWRDMLCMTPMKAGLPVAVRQLFSFIAVAASEIVTVISSNSSFISFWRFWGIVWEVLWALKLTQSQVGIVGLKIVHSLNRNRCVKFRKRNRLLVSFVVFFTALWTFWHLIL